MEINNQYDFFKNINIDADGNIVVLFDDNIFNNQIRVDQTNVATTLGGTIDSTKEYFIDGVIDCTGVQIEVPAGGINIKGFNFDLSKLICSGTSFTMFTSPSGGSGNILFDNFGIEVTGAGSQVYDLTGATGFEAYEIIRINFNDCTSLGTLTTYRQGLETGTGRFGGEPSLTLAGTWVGGYRATTTIIRNINSGMTEALFAAGPSFTMASRFLTDANVDLSATAPFIDFTSANFPNPSTLQLQGCIVSRDGIFNADDSTIIPNISKGALASDFLDNKGISNTFVGAEQTITGETATVIGTASTFVTLAGSWFANNLEHFDSPAEGQLRHLGDNPREYKVFADLNLESTANNEVEVKITKYDFKTSATTEVFTQVRQINNLVGGRNVGFFTIQTNIILDQNDYVFIEVANNTGTNDITVELESFMSVESRQ